MSMISRTLLLLLVAVAVVSGQVDRAHKPGKIKKGQTRLEARKTAYEENDQLFMAEYVKATMSFEFATRDDMKAVRNDWDICLQGRGHKRSPFEFIARTVTDDSSRIWALGKMPLSRVSRSTVRSRVKAAPLKDDEHEGHLALTGHCYLVHTVDSDSDLWAAFRVIAIIPGEAVQIEWKLLSKPKKITRKKAPPKQP